MRFLALTSLFMMLSSEPASAQTTTFAVTGTPIPSDLLRQNYGKLPKGIAAYDLNICNLTQTKQSIVSSEIFQALAKSTPGLQPIGRQIMLGAILRNQNRSFGSVSTMLLNSFTGILSMVSYTRYRIPAAVVTGSALGVITAQQLLANLRPALTADQLEKFEDQVLQPALVLDSGSCVERTVFAAAANPVVRGHVLDFHVR